MQSWYLLYCKRGQLQRAQEHLERQAVNCLAPMITLEKIVRGKRTAVSEPLFPNYLFVEFDPEVIHTTTINATRGVSHFVGCMVQSNSIAETMNTAFGIPTWVMGLIVVILAGIVFIGGVSRLAAVTEKIVPIMAVLYVLGSLVILIMNAANIPATFALIFQCAFNPDATVGGATFGIIAAISQGAKRGLFSNEAGMGSTPHAHALAEVKDPHEQGVVAMIGVFVDTIVVVTMTALVVMVSAVSVA